MYSQEIDQLPDVDRRRIRRTQRDYAAVWSAALTEMRPDLSGEAARARVHAAFGLLNAVADFTSGLDDDVLAATCTR